jgi:hypothetical protein
MLISLHIVSVFVDSFTRPLAEVDFTTRLKHEYVLSLV